MSEAPPWTLSPSFSPDPYSVGLVASLIGSCTPLGPYRRTLQISLRNSQVVVLVSEKSLYTLNPEP